MKDNFLKTKKEYVDLKNKHEKLNLLINSLDPKNNLKNEIELLKNEIYNNNNEIRILSEQEHAIQCSDNYMGGIPTNKTKNVYVYNIETNKLE